MNPARQFMDALVKFHGERLVISSDEPPFIWRNEKKGYLLSESLKDEMIHKIDEELLAAVANLIREGKTFQIPSLMQTGKALGMRLLNDGLTEMVGNGTIAADEALSKAIDKETLRQRLRSRGLLAT